MKKRLDQQKKILTLKRQLYGKEGNQDDIKYRIVSDNPIKVQTTSFEIPSVQKMALLDTAYLKKDLFKIVILASAAITIQILLFVSMSKGLINL